jgi:hypothetical protein
MKGDFDKWLGLTPANTPEFERNKKSARPSAFFLSPHVMRKPGYFKPYRRLNLSTWPAVSKIFCFPV